MERLLAALVLRFNHDANVRLEAAVELQRMGAFGPLVRLLKRENSAWFVEKIIDLMTANLSGPWLRDPALIQRAVRYLCNRPEYSVQFVPIFFQRLASSELVGPARIVGKAGNARVVAECVAQVLFHRNTSTLTDAQRQERAAVLAAFGKAAVPPLLKALRTNTQGDGDYICSALGEIGDRSIVPDLIQWVESPECNCAKALLTLARLHDDAAVDTLVSALSRDGGRYRLAAVDALCLIRSKRSSDALMSALQSADAAVRKRAAAGLIERRMPLPDSTALALLIEFVQDNLCGELYEQRFDYDRGHGTKRRYRAVDAYQRDTAAQRIAASLGVHDNVVTAAMLVLGSQVASDQVGKYGHDHVDLAVGSAALKLLCAEKSAFTTTILQRVAERQDVTVALHHDCGPSSTTHERIDFGPWRQLARQTLLKRH